MLIGADWSWGASGVLMFLRDSSRFVMAVLDLPDFLTFKVMRSVS